LYCQCTAYDISAAKRPPMASIADAAASSTPGMRWP
jgi:hypothetical protein